MNTFVVASPHYLKTINVPKNSKKRLCVENQYLSGNLGQIKTSYKPNESYKEKINLHFSPNSFSSFSIFYI